MSRLRKFRKMAIAVVLILCALVVLLVVAGQIEQRMYRRRAELLLSDVQAIELRKTSWPDVQTRLRKWKGYSKADEHCDGHRCRVEITLDETVFAHLFRRNLFVTMDDYLRWRLNLTYEVGPFVSAELWLIRQYQRVGGRPARVIATIGMRDGRAWSKGLSIVIATFAHVGEGDDTRDFEFALIAQVSSVPRFEHYNPGWIPPQLVLHPDYLIGKPGGCEGCVAGWVKFTPYAAPEDVHRLMELEFSCLTRWKSCASQSDVMPAAWAQYAAERSESPADEKPPTCSPAVIEMLGRDSADVVEAQVLRYRDTRDEQGRKQAVATVRVLKRLKGGTGWSPGETGDVAILAGTPCGEDDGHAPSHLIFYYESYGKAESAFERHVPWAALPMNDANLDLLVRGIEQDYSRDDAPQ